MSGVLRAPIDAAKRAICEFYLNKKKHATISRKAIIDALMAEGHLQQIISDAIDRLVASGQLISVDDFLKRNPVQISDRKFPPFADRQEIVRELECGATGQRREDLIRRLDQWSEGDRDPLILAKMAVTKKPHDYLVADESLKEAFDEKSDDLPNDCGGTPSMGRAIAGRKSIAESDPQKANRYRAYVWLWGWYSDNFGDLVPNEDLKLNLTRFKKTYQHFSMWLNSITDENSVSSVIGDLMADRGPACLDDFEPPTKLTEIASELKAAKEWGRNNS